MEQTSTVLRSFLFPTASCDFVSPSSRAANIGPSATLVRLISRSNSLHLNIALVSQDLHDHFEVALEVSQVSHKRSAEAFF